jgi:hypothetical protein
LNIRYKATLNRKDAKGAKKSLFEPQRHRAHRGFTEKQYELLRRKERREERILTAKVQGVGVWHAKPNHYPNRFIGFPKIVGIGFEPMTMFRRVAFAL